MDRTQSAPSTHVESTLPKPWQREQTFNDILYDWMSRAPWLAISAAAHVVVLLVLMAIPWELLDPPDETVVVTEIERAPEDVFEDPPPEERQPLDEPEELLEPVLQDVTIPETADAAETHELPADGDPDFLFDAGLESTGPIDVIGIGPGVGGKYGHRFRGRGGPGPKGGAGTDPILRDGLTWLRAHQCEDGSWDCDGFTRYCGKIGSDVCDGPGQEMHDVGMTGLALLAFLGDGNTTREGPYKEVVARGINWLKLQQDPDTGLLGEKLGHAFIYNHAIATLAICEAYYFSKSPLIKRTAQDAINYISLARNPYSAWRYDVPPSGDNDTSVTGWMVFALKSAEEAGLKVDKEAYTGALSWFDEVTDPVTGRCGYDSIGSLSSRIERVNDHYPADKGETMSAVALLCRFFMGQDPDKNEIMKKHADLLKAKPPKWDPDGLGNDAYYWYYGSYAMYQMGGSNYWDPWNKAMKSAVVDSQRKDGDRKGSWDPEDAWGKHAGGRVYMTALMVLCLEVHFRYARTR